MSETQDPSTWQRSTTRRFFAWLFSARTLRRGLITLAWAAAVIALYYGVTDWASRRAWNSFRKDFETRVASVDLRTYIPSPIPDSDNFVMNPISADWTKPDVTNSLFRHDTFSRAADSVYYHHATGDRRFTDLGAWKEALEAAARNQKEPKEKFHTDRLDLDFRASVAPAVLDGLNDDADAFEVLRAASSRPGARFPIVYNMDNPWIILLPHLAKTKQACQRLQLRSVAELAAGKSEQALQDLKLESSLADSIKTEPFIISYLVRIACNAIMIQSIWEGLAEHHWSDAQLQQLQSTLGAYDWLADYQRPIHSECAATVLTVDLMKSKGLGFLASVVSDVKGNNQDSWLQSIPLRVLAALAPAAWYDDEKRHLCEGGERWVFNAVDSHARRVYPEKVATSEKEEAELQGHGPLGVFLRHKTLAAWLLPVVSNVSAKAAAAQVATDEAIIACALERYRLTHGSFPDSLEALAPKFIPQLPNDVITGEPYKYRLNADGSFVLYSLGWDEKDDGGKPGNTLFDQKSGDWVWEYPNQG